MRLPKIYEHFRQGQIFTIDEAREKLQTTGNTLRKRLSELSARGYLFPIRQGLYRVCAADKTLGPDRSSPFAVASKVAPYCYIGFKTALQIHAEEVPQDRDTVYVVSPTKFNAFSFEGRYFFWCQSPEPYGVIECRLQDENIEFDVHVTDFEKTVIDCLRRPAHSPHFPEFVRLCGKTREAPDLEKLLRYASRCDISALYNRLGFFLDKMQFLWEVPPEFFAEVQKKMSRKLTDWPILLGSSQNGQGAQTGTNTLFSYAPSAYVDTNRWRIQFPKENEVQAGF